MSNRSSVPPVLIWTGDLKGNVSDSVSGARRRCDFFNPWGTTTVPSKIFSSDIRRWRLEEIGIENPSITVYLP